MKFLLFLLLVTLVIVANGKERTKKINKKIKSEARSCKEFGKCCKGKDNTCLIFLDNGEEKNKNGFSSLWKRKSNYCFCDSSCIETNDCCHDYHDACPPVDCEVSEAWGPWSDCSTSCGEGVMTRKRSIITHSKNGGKKCPNLMENKRCEGVKCKAARDTFIKMKDTAHLISSTHAKWRLSSEYHPRKGIRKNIFEHYQPNVTDRPSHCVEFEITKISKGCEKNKMELEKQGFSQKDINFLQPNLALGKKVCAECQETAMKDHLGGLCSGEGIPNQETNWLITSGCRGKWKMISKTENCSCSHKSGKEENGEGDGKGYGKEENGDGKGNGKGNGKGEEEEHNFLFV